MAVCLFWLALIYIMVDKNPSPPLAKVFLGRMIFNGRAEQCYHYSRSFTISNVVLFTYISIAHMVIILLLCYFSLQLLNIAMP